MTKKKRSTPSNRASGGVKNTISIFRNFRDEDEVARAGAHDLVGDREVAAPRVSRDRLHDASVGYREPRDKRPHILGA